MSVANELQRIRRMPYGTARVAAAEAITRKVEAEGPETHLAEALLDLVEAYTFSKQGSKSFVVFARLLRHWDAHPELFDAGDRHNLFWEFKWVASDLADYPQLGLPQVNAFLDDMQRRFELEGIGLSAVHASRFGWMWHSGLDGAEEARLRWVTHPRDDFNDCRACTIGQQTDYLLDQGRDAEALEIGLTQDSQCNLEPTKTHFAAALAAFNAGELRQALRLHGLALATVGGPGNRELAQSFGQSFELLARGGELDRALRELRIDYRDMLTAPPSPLLHLRFLLGVLAGLSANADRGDQRTGIPLPGTPAGDATVAELREWVAARVREHVVAFDGRSGTDYYAQREASALGASRIEPGLAALREELAREAAASSAAGGSGGSAAADPAAVDPAAVVGADPALGGGAATDSAGLDPVDAALQRAEEALQRTDYAHAAFLYEAASLTLEESGWIERAGLAAAEGAQSAALNTDEELSHRLFARAVPLLRSGGADTQVIAAVLEAWAPVAARMNDADAQIRATAAVLEGLGEFSDEGLTGELAERRLLEWRGQRASLKDTLARSLAATGGMREAGFGRERAVAEASEAAEEFARIGRIADAAHGFWLAGRVQRELGQTEQAVWSLESAFEGFSAARVQRERADVASELIELLTATGQLERVAQVVSEL